MQIKIISYTFFAVVFHAQISFKMVHRRCLEVRPFMLLRS